MSPNEKAALRNFGLLALMIGLKWYTIISMQRSMKKFIADNLEA